MTVDTFNILIVCTGNICRSPMALQMLATHILASKKQDEIVLTSAGTSAASGVGMDSFAQQALSQAGYDTRPHLARQITRDLIEQADLILCAEVANCRFVVELSVRANRYTFTFREFSNLVEQVNGVSNVHASLKEKLSHAVRYRGVVIPAEVLDLRDPFGSCLEDFIETVQDLKGVLGPITRWIGE